MKNLQLSLKTKWFNLTKQKIKPEDYREINEYWCKRLLNPYYLSARWEIIKGRLAMPNNFFKPFTQNTMTLGYPKKTDTERILILEHKGITIDYGKPEWGAEEGKLYFVIKHGEVIK
jgi:hypothetical protein